MSELEEKYPSNSHVQKKEIQRVTTASVVKPRKEPLLLRLFSNNASAVGSYILYDVLLPALKSTVSDMIKGGIDLMLYGEDKPKNLRRERDKTYVSYSSMYDHSNRRELPRRSYSQASRSRHRFEDIIIPTKGEAEQVLDVLVDYIEQYDLASVADFYELVGIQPEWADHKWGWDNISSAMIRPVRGGYIISLPKAIPFD